MKVIYIKLIDIFENVLGDSSYTTQCTYRPVSLLLHQLRDDHTNKQAKYLTNPTTDIASVHPQSRYQGWDKVFMLTQPVQRSKALQ